MLTIKERLEGIGYVNIASDAFARETGRRLLDAFVLAVAVRCISISEQKDKIAIDIEEADGTETRIMIWGEGYADWATEFAEVVATALNAKMVSFVD